MLLTSASLLHSTVALLCSETWPYFRPNFKQMEEYRQEHSAEEARPAAGRPEQHACSAWDS